MVVLLNRGVRTWDLKDGKDKEGKVVKRKLPPGGSIEALDEAEATHLLAHTREIVDAEKAIPVVADKVKALTEERDALREEVNVLKIKLEQYEDPDKKAKSKK